MAMEILISSSHIWLFEGAEGGKWLQQYEEHLPKGAAENAEDQRDAKRPRLE